MGLLDKTNPQATRESVTRHAIAYGSISVVGLLLYFIWSPPQDPRWPLLLPIAGICGAFLGGLIEWQFADGLELYEVMLEIEEEFAVKLPIEKEFDTVGELYEMTLAAQQEKTEVSVSEEVTWNRLRALLVKELGVKPEQVVPSARFYIDIKF